MNQAERARGQSEPMKLLRMQARLYGRLEELADRQASLVSDEDLNPLMALLSERQHISDELTGVGAKLAPVRQDWSRRRAELGADEQVEADRLIIAIRERLQRILRRDETDARVLSGRKEVVVRALREMPSQQQAISAYRTQGETTRSLDVVEQES